jgi:hypothetical protein
VAFYGIEWAHELAGFSNNACTSFYVTSVREAAHRILGHSVTKKEPISPDVLRQLACAFGCLNANLFSVEKFNYVYIVICCFF